MRHPKDLKETKTKEEKKLILPNNRMPVLQWRSMESKQFSFC